MLDIFHVITRKLQESLAICLFAELTEIVGRIFLKLFKAKSIHLLHQQLVAQPQYQQIIMESSCNCHIKRMSRHIVQSLHVEQSFKYQRRGIVPHHLFEGMLFIALRHIGELCQKILKRRCTVDIRTIHHLAENPFSQSFGNAKQV